METLLNPYAGGSTGGVGGGGGGGPVGAVSAPGNPLTGVKRPAGGNPVGVPRALPSSRGRDVGPAAAIKVPKLRNGNKNNEQSNIALPYNRVTPLEFLSGFCGRLSPGDCLFVDKFPPGFVNGANRSAHLNNATLGVNTMSRVVGIDGLNRLLIAAKPADYVIGENLLEVDPKQKLHDAIYNKEDGEFTLKTLARYRLDGIVKSNDEPGAFTSSGTRDAAIFNVVLQGPTLVNNGYLYYDDGSGKLDFHSGEKARLNNMTGVPDTRTVESFARGSTEAGFHVGGVGPPGRTGSPWLGASGYDFVAQFTGTYSMYPAQQFDRGVRSLDTLYVGLVAVKLDENAAKEVPGYQDGKCYFYFQYMPFSSRAAHLVQKVADLAVEYTLKTNDPVKARADAEAEITRKYVTHTKGTSRHRFDQNPFDAVRTDDLRAMVGAWHIGRVLDCKAMRYDSYAGGPADTAYALMVDVGIGWRNSRRMDEGESDEAKKEREAEEDAAYEKMTAIQRNAVDRRRVTPEAVSRMLRPPLSEVIGTEMGNYTVSSCDEWKQRGVYGEDDVIAAIPPKEVEKTLKDVAERNPPPPPEEEPPPFRSRVRCQPQQAPPRAARTSPRGRPRPRRLPRPRGRAGRADQADCAHKAVPAGGASVASARASSPARKKSPARTRPKAAATAATAAPRPRRSRWWCRRAPRWPRRRRSCRRPAPAPPRARAPWAAPPRAKRAWTTCSIGSCRAVVAAGAAAAAVAAARQRPWALWPTRRRLQAPRRAATRTRPGHGSLGARAKCAGQTDVASLVYIHGWNSGGGGKGCLCV